MLSKKILAQIQHLQLKAGHMVTDALAGEYSSAFKGSGMEFEKVREYCVGDDIRGIDWNVTARMSSPYVKVFREERELTLMLLVDCSNSLDFGTKSTFKNEKAAELAGILAFLAIKNHDKVGLILFSDHVEKVILPKKGKAHIWNLIKTVLTHESTGGQTRIDHALVFFNKMQKRKCLSFLISDFWQEGSLDTLKHVAKRHDMVCVSIADPFESQIVNCGFVEFKDLESGENVLVDTSDAKAQKFFEGQWEKLKKQREHEFIKNGIDHFWIETHKSSMNPLVKFIRGRERKGLR
jgi:uncharacterized protein (DUF58 family)